MVIDWHAILPALILSGTILVVLVTDLFLPQRHKSASMWVALLGVLATLVAKLRISCWAFVNPWRNSATSAVMRTMRLPAVAIVSPQSRIDV